MIGFYHENEEYGCFSNWYQAEFDYVGKHYANTEQYIMYQKAAMFMDFEIMEAILETADPGKCKQLGRKVAGFNAGIWTKTSYVIAKRGIKAKFAQNEDILKILLDTGNEILAECSLNDTKWGIGIDINDPNRLNCSMWKGENLLGRILMEVREELRLDLLCSKDGKLSYPQTRDLEPIDEWKMRAGELKRIPQYYSTIHAYADTLPYKIQQSFYYDFTLDKIDFIMKTNMGGGLPIMGFYELKQDVYDISSRLRNLELMSKRD